jgi:Transcriptional regulators
MADIITAAREFIASPLYFEATPRQLAMLGIVCDEPGKHSVKALASTMGVAKPIVTRATNVMEASGLVQRVRCRDDRRVTYVLPTEKGQALRRELGRC